MRGDRTLALTLHMLTLGGRYCAQVHFCYLCRNLLRGAKAGDGARHFGPKGCKQHTAG